MGTFSEWKNKIIKKFLKACLLCTESAEKKKRGSLKGQST